MSPADDGEDELVAQVNVRVTQGMLDDLSRLCGRWIPKALVARKALEIGLRHLVEHPGEVQKLEPRKTGPKPKADPDEKPGRKRSRRSDQ